MSIRSRFALIVSGIIIFGIFAPVILFFARGFRYDFANHEIIRTGLLVVKSEPRGAQVFLNGRELGKTPLTKRFINPGDYDVTLKKDNYAPWKKRATILPEQVSYLPITKEKVNLFLEGQHSRVLSTSTLDFMLADGSIFFVEKNPQSGLDFYKASPSGENKTHILNFKTIPGSGAELLAVRSPASEFIVKIGSQLWYVSPGASFLVPAREARFGGAGNLIAINLKSQLVSIDINQENKIIAENVWGFLSTPEAIYYLTAQSPKNNDLVQLLPNGEKRILLSKIPFASKNQILVTPGKQFFLILGTAFYQVAEKLIEVANDVRHISWNSGLNGFVYGNANEIWTYDTASRTPNRLLVRNSQAMSAPALSNSLGYVFYASARKLKGFETDTSGQPNLYDFIDTVNFNIKLAAPEDPIDLIYLDGPTLNILKIR